GLAGAGPTPIKPAGAEEALIGQIPGETVWREAASLAAAAADPESDVRAPAAYRRHVIQVLTRRALADAARASRSTDRT
ncbi:MAG TPA: xanthine dehydrogenase family protein subunit M, partial [Dehalococcoidia bacterium]|nr:xanthine dehydrogenase family protein subunit M [Dehalococcoidia bacterium]